MAIRAIIDFDEGVVRPWWTDMEAVGLLSRYLDLNDDTPTETQMAIGYRQSSGFDPYPYDMPRNLWRVDNWAEEGKAQLVSLTYLEDEPYQEVSRCTAGDGATVIVFDAAFTAVMRDGEVDWVARLD